MSLRVVLAVALSVAILGVAVPGVDRAAEKRTADAIRTEVGAVTDAGDSLLERDELTPEESPGARRVVTVSLPARSWHAAGVDYLALAGSPPDETGGGSPRLRRVTYRLEDGPRRTFPVAVPLAPTAGRPVVLREPGEHRLVLSLGTRDGDRVVVVERAGRRRSSVPAFQGGRDRPRVDRLPGFIRDRSASAGHAGDRSTAFGGRHRGAVPGGRAGVWV